MREAEEQDKSFTAHLTHLIIHGFLHLIGYDHQTPRRPTRWRSWSAASRRTLGLSDPYEGSAPVDGPLSKGTARDNV